MHTELEIDAEVAAGIAAIPSFVLDDAAVAFMRSMKIGLGVAPIAGVVREEHTVPGDPPVPVRLHRPATAVGSVGAAEKLPCVVSIHGGGYVMGSYEMDDATFNTWCPALNLVGISIEYRLAPETAYPGPLQDCYRALLWAFDNADELGIDRNCIGIHGVSAGGGLAAALALHARDRGEVEIAFQTLDCPMLDDRQMTTSSQLEGLQVWSRESNTFGWRAYLGDLYGTDAVAYTAAPARASDLAGLPPAFVSVGTVDGFRDEDIDYALRLNQAGVPTELHVYPGAPHGYHIAADSAIAKQSARDKSDWIARQIARRIS